MITLNDFLDMGWIAQRIKVTKGADWRACHAGEAKGFLPKEWLESHVKEFESHWDEFYIELIEEVRA